MLRSEIIENCHYPVFNPVQFGSEDCSPGHFFGPSVRTHWLLHYVADGFGTFVRENTTHRLGPGEIFVIPPYLETYYEADLEKPWRYIWIGFTSEDALPAAFQEPVIHCPEAGAIFEGMLLCGRMGSGRSAFLCSRLWELSSLLLEQGQPDGDFVKKALDYMNSEYINGITVQQVAAKLNVNRSYFSESFKARMGIPPGRYLTNLRMERAAELLTLHGESPTTAALSTGYSDLYHFSRAFKQHFGCSPRNYQKSRS